MSTSGSARATALSALLALVVVLLAGCGSGADDGGSTDAPVPGLPAPSDPTEPDGPGEPTDPGEPGGSGGPGESDEPAACGEVRAGIDDFNRGDFDATVEHFVAAVPLAEESDDLAGTRATGDLLDAVRYYAELPPEDYREASATSPEFERNKIITLGQCVAPAPPGSPGDEDPGVPV